MNKLSLSLLTILFGSINAYTVRIVTEGNLLKSKDQATLNSLKKDLKKTIEKHAPKKAPVTVEFAPIFKDTKDLLRDLYIKRDPKTGKPVIDPHTGKVKEESGFDVDYKDTQKVTEAGGNPTYGEVTAHAVDAVFDTSGLVPDSALIDIGCGVGKFLLHGFIERPEFVEVVGFDLCKGRIDKAQLAKKRLLETVKAEEDNIDPEVFKRIMDPSRKIEFNLADAQKVDWSRFSKYVLKGGKVISWICATCFSPAMMNKLANNYVKFAKDVIAKSKGDVKGDIVVYTLKDFYQDKSEFAADKEEFDKYFEKEETVRYDMTWSSNVDVHKYVLKKRNLPK